MLEPPILAADVLPNCLAHEFGVQTQAVEFLPLGADLNTAVYRATAIDGSAYFLKLRRGEVDPLTVAIPQLLAAQSVAHVIAPLPTLSGAHWARIAGYTVTLAPFVTGQNGYDQPLSDRHWVELGTTLRQLHALELPPELRARVPVETYTAHWRATLRSLLQLANGDQFIDAAAEQMAALFRERHDQIIALIERTERMAAQLIGRPAVFVLCHADIHAFNVLIDRHDKLWVVDWDTLILAPPERDLMFIGAGIGGIWDQQREAELFYQGYGTVSVDPIALSYYRAERIVQDLVSYGEYVFLSAEGGADRAEAVRQVAGQFLPGGVIDLI